MDGGEGDVERGCVAVLDDTHRDRGAAEQVGEDAASGVVAEPVTARDEPPGGAGVFVDARPSAGSDAPVTEAAADGEVAEDESAADAPAADAVPGDAVAGEVVAGEVADDADPADADPIEGSAEDPAEDPAEAADIAASADVEAPAAESVPASAAEPASEGEHAAVPPVPARRRGRWRRGLALAVVATAAALAVSAFATSGSSTTTADQHFVDTARTQGFVIAPGEQETTLVSAARKICDRRENHSTSAARRATALTPAEVGTVSQVFGNDSRPFTTLALDTYCAD
jgi:hypothetical protein